MIYIILLCLTVFDIDYDNTYTYLFEDRKHAVSFSSPTPLTIHQGECKVLEVRMTCEDAYTIYDWYPEKVKLCTATTIKELE